MTPPAPHADFADRLSSDVSSLIATLRSPWTWLLALALLAAIAGAWRLRQLVSQDRRLTPRVRAVAAASLNALTVAVIAVVVTWFLWRRAPLLLGITLAVLAAAAGVGVAIRSRAWMWGLTTIWRGRVRIGDRLHFGDVDGTVVDVGIFAIAVVGGDGARVLVPNAKLAGGTFAIASPEEVHPAQITVRARAGELTDAELELLRRIGALCPYRQRGALVAVEVSADRHAATVSFRSWSEEGAALAREHVQRSFAAPADNATPGDSGAVTAGRP